VHPAPTFPVKETITSLGWAGIQHSWATSMPSLQPQKELYVAIFHVQETDHSWWSLGWAGSPHSLAIRMASFQPQLQLMCQHGFISTTITTDVSAWLHFNNNNNWCVSQNNLRRALRSQTGTSLKTLWYPPRKEFGVCLVAPIPPSSNFSQCQLANAFSLSQSLTLVQCAES